MLFDDIHKYSTKILILESRTKLMRKYIFKPTSGNESLHKNGKESGVRTVNLV